MITPILILAGIMYWLAAADYFFHGEIKMGIVFGLYGITNFVFSTIQGVK